MGSFLYPVNNRFTLDGVAQNIGSKLGSGPLTLEQSQKLKYCYQQIKR